MGDIIESRSWIFVLQRNTSHNNHGDRVVVILCQSSFSAHALEISDERFRKQTLELVRDSQARPGLVHGKYNNLRSTAGCNSGGLQKNFH